MKNLFKVFKNKDNELKKSLNSELAANIKLQGEPKHYDYVVALGRVMQRVEEFCNIHDKASEANIISLRAFFNEEIQGTIMLLTPNEQKEQVEALMAKLQSEGAIKGIAKENKYKLSPKTEQTLEEALKKIVESYQSACANDKIRINKPPIDSKVVKNTKQ